MDPGAPTDFPWLGVGILLGAVCGLGAASLADALPTRAGITHRPDEAARKRRNFALVALCTLAGAALAVRSTGPGTPALVVAFVTGTVFVAMLACAASVDLEHMILPNEVTLGGAAIALVTSPFRPLGLRASLVGAAVAIGISVLPAMIYKAVRGHGGVGLGDAKLTLFAGAWFGFEGAVFVLFAGALQSALAAVVMRVAGLSFPVPESVKAEIAELRARAKSGDEEARALLADDPMAVDDAALDGSLVGMRLPMGPLLALACVEFLFFRGPILAAAHALLAP